jgi:hypothetical protein
MIYLGYPVGRDLSESHMPQTIRVTTVQLSVNPIILDV